MLHREIIAVCSRIHTKHINTVCGLNVEFVSVKKAVLRQQKPLGLKGLIHLQSRITSSSYFLLIAEDDLAENVARICGMSVPPIVPLGSYIAKCKTEQ